MISIKSFTFRYRGATEPALENIDLEIPRGQFCAIIGANGSGKSTLCFALSGIIPHHFAGEYSGIVRIAGRELVKMELGQMAGLVGLVFQNPFNQITGARYTVEEEIAFGLENLGIPQDEMSARIALALQQAGLVQEAHRSPYALSGGQQQRLAIASILAIQPDILILDEPTSQLDPVGTREVFELLARLGDSQRKTIVLVEHKLELAAQFADRVVHLNHGRIIADGKPQEVLGNPRLRLQGVQPTRFTLAAALSQEQAQLPSDRTLPVTLEQAIGFFR